MTGRGQPRSLLVVELDPAFRARLKARARAEGMTLRALVESYLAYAMGDDDAEDE